MSMNGELFSINGHISLMYGIFLLLFKVDEEILQNNEYFRYLSREKSCLVVNQKDKANLLSLLIKR